MTATPAQVRNAIETYVAAWANNDRQLLLSVIAEGARWTDPVGCTPTFLGHTGVAKLWDFVRQDGACQFAPKVHRIIACGSEGVLDFTMQMRVPALNQGLDLHVIDRFVFDAAGKIQTLQAYWDEASVSVPPGMVPYAPNLDAVCE